MMSTTLQQPRGSTMVEINKMDIARLFGTTHDKVTYLNTGVDITNFDILYDKNTEKCFKNPNGTGTITSSQVVDGVLTLVTSTQSYTIDAAIYDSTLVSWVRDTLSHDIKTVSDMLDAQPIYCYEFADLITSKGSVSDPTTWDWTPAIDAAIAKSKSMQFQPVVLPPHSIITTGGHVLTSKVKNFSGGSASDGVLYSGVPLIGYGLGISKIKFRPAASNSVCISLVGNGGGHKTTTYMRDFSIEPESSSYQLLGYGIEYNCVNYVYTNNVSIYMLNENFRFLNGISNGWTEFNTLTNCFSYRGNVCFSFVRTAGNDSFNGMSFINCFGQIKKTNGGYGIKATGVSSSALVWIYGGDFDIKFYGGDAACKVISLAFSELTLNTGDLHCEGTVVMEALDDSSRMAHGGKWLNNGTTNFSVVNELAGAQGRFVFMNAQSKSTPFASSDLSSFVPYSLSTTPETYSVNGAYPAVFRAEGTNFSSPFFACYQYSGNGFYFGQVGYQKSLSDFTPSWKLSNDGGIIKSYNTTFRFQLGPTETFRISTTALYPYTTSGMQLGMTSNKWDAGYFEQLSITDAGIIPTTTAKYDIGNPTSTINNLYVQNAPTVVSDKEHKEEIQDISDELLDAWGDVNFQMWKMKAAVLEKGSDEARWHVGYIAQDIRDVLTKAGLDWTRYGLITHTKWDAQDAVLDEEGEAVEPAKEAGEIYMLRMEECLTVEMAYQRRKIEQLEKLLKSK